MRIILMLVATSLLVASCGGSEKKKKVDKKVLFGSIEGKTYKNSFFNFKVDVGDEWEDNTLKFRTTFGGELLQIEHTESNNKSYPVVITIEADKANPFEKANPIKQAEESIEGYEMLFDENELTKHPLSKTTIGGMEYVANQMSLSTDGDKSYIDEYFAYKGGYYISIIVTYNDPLDEKIVSDFISSIKKLK